MKKKIVAYVFISSLLMVSLAGCNQKKAVSEISEEVSIKPDFPVSISDTAPDSLPSPQYKTVRFHIKKDYQSLYIDLPDSWTLEKSSDSSVYDICRDSLKIGKVMVNTKWEPDADKEVLSSAITDNKTAQQRKYTYKNGQISLTRCLYVFDMKDNRAKETYRIEADANEIGEEAMKHILDSASIKQDTSKTDRALWDSSKDNCRIAFVGNSFLGTSQVGEILQMMTEKTNKNITIDQNGHADIDKNYPGNFLDKLESGTYDIVFYCGFYSPYDTLLFNDVVKASKKSDTRLVVFPAHNEVEEFYKSAYSDNDGIYLADWKMLINSLINEGLPYEYFCINDQHKHSTEIGGYAGACLLYTLLYKQEPPSVYEPVLSKYSTIYSYGLKKGSEADVFKKIEQKAIQWNSAKVPAYDF